MNIIQKIKTQLEDFRIGESFFQFYTQVNNFKLKFFAPIMSCIVLAWIVFCFLKFNIHFQSFSEGFFFFLICGFIQPLAMTFGFAHFTSINGRFFKWMSKFWSKNQTLKSFIDSANYQDSILSSLFDNQDFKNNLISFYRFLDKINFATSYQKDVINHKNKEIKEHLDKLVLIIEEDNKKEFQKFFKKKFISDFQTYSYDEKVLEMLQMTGHLHTESIPKNMKLGDDLLEAMREELKLKDKFKKVL